MKSFNFRFVLNFLGLLIVFQSIMMLIIAFVGKLCHDESFVVSSFYSSVVITLTIGLIFLLFGKRNASIENSINVREGFFSVTFAWILLSFTGLLPYYISGYIPNFVNAFFETISGYTTTGSTILNNIEEFPKSLLLWRALTHWIGGIGIIVFVLVFVPLFGGSAVSLYRAEVSGFLSNQIKPRVAQVAKRLFVIYVGFSLLGFILLWLGPMDAFDAITHTFAAIATGGFSTKQASIAAFNSSYVEYVLIFLMFVGGTNFSLMFLVFRNKSLKPLVRDQEFRWYFIIAVSFTVLIALSLILQKIIPDVEYAFRSSLFSVVSVMTSTGFATVDYTLWGVPYWIIFLLLMLFCASAGSTSGGMKISRLVIMVKSLGIEFKKQVHPQAVFTVFYNKKPVPKQVVSQVFNFVIIYLFIFAVGALLISISGIPFEESIGASLTSISNVGPGLGVSGPCGTFAHFDDFSKIIMCLLMLIGRLEVFTVLSLFIPSFWK